MTQIAECPGCGRAVRPEDAFCGGCGASLTNPSMARGTPPPSSPLTGCRRCGSAILPGDSICRNCGAPRGDVGSVPSPSGRGSQWRVIRDRLAAATQGEFEIVRMVGYGAMGAVFLAQDVALGRAVAIKVMSPALLMDDAMVERFRLEARTIASLRHQNIVTVHAVRQLEDLHYFVMDFVPGPSLRTVLASEPNGLSIPIVKALLFQIANGLGYAHRRGGGIVHRDIKPSNILIDHDGNAIVTDFGISKVADSSAGLTMTGMIIGTPEYMSPEQWRDEPLSGASDQYALGVVAYEMLCGEAPFKGPQHVVMAGHLNREPEPITARRPDCPDPLAEAVMRMLAKAAADRWPSLSAAVAHFGGQPLAHGHPVQVEIAAIADRHIRSSAQAPTDSQAESAPRTPPAGGAASVVIARFPSRVEPGDEFDIRAYVQNARGSEVGNAEVAWSSGDPGVAEVSDGKVKALRPGSVAITASVEGFEDTLVLTVSEPEVARVSLSPASVRLEVGEEIDLSVEARDRQDKILEVSPVWTSNREGVARVSDRGRVTAVGTGTGTITVGCGDVEATASITVTPAAVATVELGDVPSDLEPGDRFEVTATVLDARGRTLEERPVTWEVGDPSVLRLSSEGVGTALAPGSTTIRARAEGQVASASLTVRPPTVTAVEIQGAPALSFVGDAFQLRAQVRGRDGRTVDLPVTWTSTDTSVATVDAGNVTATAPGRSQIRATAGEVTGTVQVEVEARTVASVRVRPASGRVEVGASLKLAAEARDQRDQPITGRAEWSTTDPRVAVVTPEGEVYGLAPGTAAIVARVGAVEARADLRVVPAAVTSIEISAPSTTLFVGDEAGLEASLTDARGEPVTGRDVQWRSSDDGILAVDRTGRVTAGRPGSAVVHATCEGQTASLRLTVSARPAVEVSIRAPDSISVGQRATLKAIPRDEEGREVRCPVSWTSSDPMIATVNDKGRLRARRAGLVTVVAAADSARGTAALEVEPRTGGWPRRRVVMALGGLGVVAAAIAAAVLGTGDGPAEPEVASLVVSPRTLAMEPGQSSLLRAQGVTQEGEAVADATVAWSIDNPAVASVEPDGTVTALDVGTAVVSASLGGVVSNVRLTVTAPPAERLVQSVDVVADRTTLDVGEQALLSAEGLGSDGETVDAGPPVWSVDDPAVLRIGQDGVAVARAAGTVQVTATIDGVRGTRQLTVRAGAPPEPQPGPARVASLGLSVTSTAMTQGARQDVAVEVRMTDGTVRRSLGQGGSLTSSDPNVVAVDGGSLVARAAGSAFVIASVGGSRDSVRVTVRSRIAGVRIESREARVGVGEEVTLGAAVLDAGGQTVPGQAPSWSSSDPAIATVRGPGGTVRGMSPGTVRITAQVGALVDDVTVTVTGTTAPTQATAQQQAEALLALLNSGEPDRVANLLTGAAADDLLDLMGENRFEASLRGVGPVQAPGDQASFPLEADVQYRDGFGRGRERVVGLQVVLVRGGDGWILGAVDVRSVRED